MYEGQIFKTIKSNNYTITPFKTHKQWSFVPSNYSSSGIQISYGNVMTGSTFSTESSKNEDNSYKELLYSFVNNKYYQNTSSYYLTTSPNITRSMGTEFIFFGIPQQRYGEEIKPGSFELLYSTYKIIDDTYGNLIDLNNSNLHVGNIYYQDGNIVITDTGSYYTNFSTASFTSFGYKGGQTLYEHEILTEIGKGELNSTDNISIFKENLSQYWTTSSGWPLTYISESSEWSGSSILDIDGFGPYITTIGLYNDNYECLVVARLAKPIKNDKDIDYTFKIRFDA